MELRFSKRILPILKNSAAWNEFFEILLGNLDEMFPYELFMYNGFPLRLDLTDLSKAYTHDIVYFDDIGVYTEEMQAAVDQTAEILQNQANQQSAQTPRINTPSQQQPYTNIDWILQADVRDAQISYNVISTIATQQVLTEDMKDLLEDTSIVVHGEDVTAQEIYNYVSGQADSSVPTTWVNEDVSSLYDLANTKGASQVYLTDRMVTLELDFKPPVHVKCTGCRIKSKRAWVSEGSIESTRFQVYLTGQHPVIEVTDRFNQINWEVFRSKLLMNVDSTIPEYQIYPNINSISRALTQRGIKFRIYYEPSDYTSVPESEQLFEGALFIIPIACSFMGHTDQINYLKSDFLVNPETDYVFAKTPRKILGCDRKWIETEDIGMLLEYIASSWETEPNFIKAGTDQDNRFVAISQDTRYGSSILRKGGTLLKVNGDLTGRLVIELLSEVTYEDLQFIQILDEILPLGSSLVVRQRKDILKDVLKINEES